MAEERKIKSSKVGYLGDSPGDYEMLLFVVELKDSYLVDSDNPFVRGLTETLDKVYRVTRYEPSVAGSLGTSDSVYFVEVTDKSKLAKIASCLRNL